MPLVLAAQRNLAAVVHAVARVQDHLIAELQPLETWTFGGDGATRHKDLIDAAGGRFLPQGISRPRAEALLHLIRERPDGRIEDVHSWQPEYLLPSAAERLSDGQVLP